MNPRRALSIRFRPLLARLGGWPRRTLAAGLLLAAVAVGVLGGRSATPGPAPPQPVTVLAAARDLPAGSELHPADLRVLRLPPEAVPAHALTPGATVAGRRLAGPVRRGETLTDVRLVGAGLTNALVGSGLVAVPVQLANSAAVGLLHPGDHVDVLAAHTERLAHRTDSGTGPPGPSAGSDTVPEPDPATGTDTGQATGRDHDSDRDRADVLASNLAVLAVPPSDPQVSGGGWVVLAASEAAARRLAGIADTDRLTVTIRPP